MEFCASQKDAALGLDVVPESHLATAKFLLSILIERGTKPWAGGGDLCGVCGFRGCSILMPIGDLIVADENRPECFAQFDETGNVLVGRDVLRKWDFFLYSLKALGFESLTSQICSKSNLLLSPVVGSFCLRSTVKAVV